MKFSVFTASTPDWDVDQAAEQISHLGFDGIEWRITDQDDADTPGFWAGNRATWSLTDLESNVDRIAKLTEKAGLAFSGIGGYTFTSEPHDTERMFAATATLGARQVRVRVPWIRDCESVREAFSRTKGEVARLTERARLHNVKMLIELHHESIVASASAAIRMVDGLDPTHVGVLHDVGNIIFEGFEDYRYAFETLGPYLAHVHVKNARWKLDADGWHAEFAPLSEGVADIGVYFAALHRAGYDGWVALEDFSTNQPLAQRTADNLAHVRTAWLKAVGQE